MQNPCSGVETCKIPSNGYNSFSGYIKSKELQWVNNNLTVFKICLMQQCTKIFVSGNSLDNLLIFRFFVCVLQCVID